MLHTLVLAIQLSLKVSLKPSMERTPDNGKKLPKVNSIR